MKHLYKVQYRSLLPFLQSFDVFTFSKKNLLLWPSSFAFQSYLHKYHCRLINCSQIILLKNISKFKFRSAYAWNEVSYEELQNMEEFEQSVLNVYFVVRLFKEFFSMLYEDTSVDACFSTSADISILAFTHCSNILVHYFWILEVKVKTFVWSTFSTLFCKVLIQVSPVHLMLIQTWRGEVVVFSYIYIFFKLRLSLACKIHKEIKSNSMLVVCPLKHP